MANDSRALIELNDITKVYQMGSQEVRALAGVSLQVFANEYVAIMGPSGSGKSTMMNIIGCLDTPTSGEYYLNSQQVSQMTDNELAVQIILAKLVLFSRPSTCCLVSIACKTLSCRWSMPACVVDSAANRLRTR